MLKTLFWDRLTVLSLLLGTVTFSGIHPAIAQEQQRILSVTGRGSVTVPTTIARVRLGIEIEGKTAQTVQEEVARRSAALVRLLRNSNVDKLQTTGVRLNPIYDRRNDRRYLTGYTATNTVSFRVATEEAGKLIDAAVKTGATRVDGINFIATDEVLEQARLEALRDATADAQSQANAVLGALNLSQREIIRIHINQERSPIMTQSNITNMAPDVGDFQARTVLVGGEQEVQGFVTLQISY